jgi:hypothetical protein
MNQAFSKILILIILIIFAGGGIFVWQYFSISKEKKGIPEVVVKEQEMATTTVNDFMDSRIKPAYGGKGDLDKAKSYLTDNAKEDYSQIQFIDFALVGISNPHFSRYEILEIEQLDLNNFKFIVRVYESLVEAKEKDDFQYFDEELTVIKINDNYLVDSVKRGEFVIIQDETANWETYRSEELGFEFKYPKDVTIKTRLPEVLGVDIRNFSLLPPIDWNITKGRNQLNKTAQDYANFAGGTGLKSKTIDNCTVNGIGGRKVILEFYSDHELGLANKFIQVFIVKGDFVYTFNCTNRMDDKEYDCTLFNQMLSTFRFIDETADWQTYTFDVKNLISLQGLTEEKQEEVSNKVKERKLENYSFEIKYPIDWTAYTWPLHGAIVPEGLIIEEDPDNHKGCSLSVSFYAEPEKEQYCFPITFSDNESNSEECERTFNQILSTFRFLE